MGQYKLLTFKIYIVEGMPFIGDVQKPAEEIVWYTDADGNTVEKDDMQTGVWYTVNYDVTGKSFDWGKSFVLTTHGISLECYMTEFLLIR